MRCTHLFTLSQLAQGLAVSFHLIHGHSHAHWCLSVLFLLSFYFLPKFTFHLFLLLAMVPNDSMNNPLCHSAIGSMVTFDYRTPDTVPDRPGQPDNDVHKRHKPHKKIDVMEDIDSVLSNVQSARQEALLYVFEENEAVIKMIIKGRSPTMRHVSRTHRVALDWLFDRINLDSKIQIKYIDTKNQLADILTIENFTRDEWNHFLSLFNISHFSSTVCSAAMAKRFSTRIRRRTSHSKIKTNDEFDSEDAFDRVVFNFIKPGEDMVRISGSWEICCGR